MEIHQMGLFAGTNTPPPPVASRVGGLPPAELRPGQRMILNRLEEELRRFRLARKAEPVAVIERHNAFQWSRWCPCRTDVRIASHRLAQTLKRYTQQIERAECPGVR